MPADALHLAFGDDGPSDATLEGLDALVVAGGSAALDPALLDRCHRRGVRVVVDAGAGSAPDAGRALERRLATIDVDLVVGHVAGVDLLGQIDDGDGELVLRHADTGVAIDEAGLRPLRARARIGGWGIREALDLGADVVVVDDLDGSAAAVGLAAWHHGWQRVDWDELAGAATVGRVLERALASSPATGLATATIYVDGSAMLEGSSAAAGTSPDEVTRWLLHGVRSDEEHEPDVTVRLRSIRLTPRDGGRVAMSTLRALPGRDRTAVAVDAAGSDGEGSAWPGVLPGAAPDHVAVVGDRRRVVPAPPTTPPALQRRAPSRGGPPSVDEGPPARRIAPPTASTHPETISTLVHDLAKLRLHAGDGGATWWDDEPTERTALGEVASASIDADRTATSLSVWVRDDDAFDWLSWHLTPGRLRSLLPSATEGVEVERHDLPNLLALTFVLGPVGDAPLDATLLAHPTDVPRRLLPR